MKTPALLFLVVFLASSGPFANAAEEKQKTMTEQEMQERLKQMEKEMTEIRQTTNPEERTRLMHEHMGHMRGMMTDDMGCGEGGHMRGHQPKQ
jgi:hypothetical protein